MNIIFRHFCPLNTVPDWAKYNHSQKTHICLYTKVITLYHILQRKCQTLHVCIISPTSASGWSLRAERTSSRERTNNSAYPTDLTSAVRLQEKLAFYIAWVQRYIHILVCPNQCTHQINLRVQCISGSVHIKSYRWTSAIPIMLLIYLLAIS